MRAFYAALAAQVLGGLFVIAVDRGTFADWVSQPVFWMAIALAALGNVTVWLGLAVHRQRFRVQAEPVPDIQLAEVEDEVTVARSRAESLSHENKDLLDDNERLQARLRELPAANGPSRVLGIDLE